MYDRRDSKFWWIEYIDAAGKRRQESTKMLRSSSAQTRRARRLRDELTAREVAAKIDNAAGVGPRAELWQVWVPRFLAQRYTGGDSELTLYRAQAAWNNIAPFLAEKQIAIPRQLERQHVRDFIEWRAEAHPKSGTHKGAKNTALLEIKFLSLIVDEAVASGFCNTNPCQRLGIGRDEPKRKAAITDAEHRLITRTLKSEAEWMRISYEIAWEQGCRFSETMINLGTGRGSDVDLTNDILRLRTKGKKKRVAEVPLSPRLRPLFRSMIKQGRKTTFEKSVIPKGGAGKAWWKFFRKIGLPHLSFHSTRVSFITRCYEAGIPEPDVMRICLHSSATVHRVYPRLPAASRHLQTAMALVAKAERAA